MCDKDKFEKIKNLKSKNICVTDIKARDAEMNNAEIQNLNVDKIIVGGVDITCSLNQPAVETGINVFLDLGVTGPATVDTVVYDALVENAKKNRTDLQCRIYDGRCCIDQYLRQQGCPESCPLPELGEGPTGCYVQFVGSISGTTLNVISVESGVLEDNQVVLGPGVLEDTEILSQTSGTTGGVGIYEVNNSQDIAETDLKSTQSCTSVCELAPIPLKVFGAMTLPIYTRVLCGGVTGSDPVVDTGSTGSTGPVEYFDLLNTAMSFNLQCTYLLEVAKSIEPRVVSVLIQTGYYDEETSSVIIDEVFIANKQLYPTLDTLYGENFANTISIPSSVLGDAYQNSRDPGKQGAIQMVVYEEEGICIWNPVGDAFECRFNQGRIKNTNATSERQGLNPCKKGQKLCSGWGGRDGICQDCSPPKVECIGEDQRSLYETRFFIPNFCVPCNEPCYKGKPVDECNGKCY